MCSHTLDDNIRHPIRMKYLTTAIWKKCQTHGDSYTNFKLTTWSNQKNIEHDN